MVGREQLSAKYPRARDFKRSGTTYIWQDGTRVKVSLAALLALVNEKKTRYPPWHIRNPETDSTCFRTQSHK